MTAWLTLGAAGVMEIIWALGLKSLKASSPLWLHGLTYSAMLFSFVLLSRAMQTIPVGTAYAVWTGIGATGVAIAGMAIFGEPAPPLRLLFIAMIILGIVGLKATAG